MIHLHATQQCSFIVKLPRNSLLTADTKFPESPLSIMILISLPTWHQNSPAVQSRDKLIRTKPPMGWVSIKIYRFNVYKPSHDNKIVLILSKVLTKTVTFGTFPADGAQQYNTTLGPDRAGKWELMDGFTIVAAPRPATSPACCIIQQRQNENNFIPVVAS